MQQHDQRSNTTGYGPAVCSSLLALLLALQPAWADDLDADGWDAAVDCDDADAAVNPDATESCNAIDDNCDASIDESGCPCAVETDGAHTFLFCTTGETWTDAQVECAAYGYHLADLDDAGEDAWLWSMATATSASNWWIGLNDLGSEGAFEWDAGSDTRYTNWRAGEPNDYDGAEDCVWYASTGAGAWNDKDCTATAYFLCEAGCTTRTVYADVDGDTYGDASVTERLCELEVGWVDDASDCDDAAPSISPAAAEVCDGDPTAADAYGAWGVDEDCDGAADDDDTSVDVSGYSRFYLDMDGDGYAGATDSTSACDVTAGVFVVAEDCDDTDVDAFPGASEVRADGIDQDCDGADSCTWYGDADGDGYGDSAAPLEDCVGPPAGYVDNADDCDDGDASLGVYAEETCNAADDDCDGTIDDGADCPGISASYDDHLYVFSTTAATWPDAQSVCTSIGYHLVDVADAPEEAWLWIVAEALDALNPWWQGYNDGEVEGSFVWDGGSPSTFTDWRAGEPNDYGGAEDCGAFADDGAGAWNDRDCENVLPFVCELGCEKAIWYADADADGFGDATQMERGCEAPPGFVADDNDCDDTSESISPAGVEVCGGDDENCDDVYSTLDDTDCVEPDPEGDRDGDGVQNGIERELGIDHQDPDSDDDSLPDAAEVEVLTTDTAGGDDIWIAPDTDDDGLTDPLDTDDDGDTIPTSDEVGDPTAPADTDGDGTPDHRDADSDGDGMSDASEAGKDSDLDGIPNVTETDDDGDGRASADESLADADGDGAADPDIDGDGVPNALDRDSDGDGCLDADENEEAWLAADPACGDENAHTGRSPDAEEPGEGPGPECGCGTLPAAPGVAALLPILAAVRRRRAPRP